MLGPELIPDGSFESGNFDEWEPRVGTGQRIEISDEVALSGDRSLHMTAPTEGDWPMLELRQRFFVEGGKSYQWGFSSLQNEFGPVQMLFTFTDNRRKRLDRHVDFGLDQHFRRQLAGCAGGHRSAGRSGHRIDSASTPDQTGSCVKRVWRSGSVCRCRDSAGSAWLSQRFTLIAHRGFSSDSPENTYDAFDLAIENGFNNIETDVQLTSDGVPVLIHDDTLDRTTTGKGLVAEASLAYINSLEAGLWFEGPADTIGRKGPAAYGDSFVPTLEEFLKRYEGNVNLHLELKSKQPDLAAKAAELLDEYRWVKPWLARRTRSFNQFVSCRAANTREGSHAAPGSRLPSAGCDR